MTLIHRFSQSLVFVTLLLFSAYSQSNHTKEQPQIIIIIDDVGYHEHDAYAFSLPNSVAVAIIPHTPLSALWLAILANWKGSNYPYAYGIFISSQTRTL